MADLNRQKMDIEITVDATMQLQNLSSQKTIQTQFGAKEIIHENVH